MKVTITTPFARLSVEMDAMKAATLLTEALIAAVPEPEKKTEERATPEEYADAFRDIIYTELDCQKAPVVPDLTVVEKEAPPAPDTISTEPAVPAAPAANLTNDSEFDMDPEQPEGFSAEEPTPKKGYQGFLNVKCSHCHKEKSFHIKWPLKEFRCECGHTTPLRGLSKVVARCDCGWDLKYYTNQDADSFELKCISCDKPVLVKWNFRRKRYEKAD